ncbi:MAG: MBOAT family O-acyltransferase [Planctomycetaceae bacterium]
MEGNIHQLITALFAAFTVALAIWPLLRARGNWSLVGQFIAVAGICLAPLLIGSESIKTRALCSLVCIDLIFRVCDYGRQSRLGIAQPATWRAYAAFLVPFPILVDVFGERERARKRRSFTLQDAAWLVGSLLCFALVFEFCRLSGEVRVLRESFLVDHVVKVVLFIFSIEISSVGLSKLEKLFGYEVIPFNNHAYAAESPADFWYRYNQRVRHWLYLNVFATCGGRRNRTLGVLAVFFVSALFHEYFFALATSHPDGKQFAFFLLQAPAVLLSPKLKQLAARNMLGKFTAHALTILWFALTSPLFFAGVDRVFPFVYASR